MKDRILESAHEWRTRVIARVRSLSSRVAGRGRHNRGRALAIGAVVLIALAGGLGAAFGLGVATFVVVVYGTLFSAFDAVGLQPLPARPELQVGFWRNGHTTQLIEIASVEQSRIDITACVNEQVQAARATVTPKERPSPADPHRGLAYSALSMVEPYETSQSRFEQELAEYTAELTTWLEGYESRRWPNHGRVVTRIATHNDGETVAEGITLQIVLPKGVVPLTKPNSLNVDAPPTRPTFKRKSYGDIAISSLIPATKVQRVEPTDLPRHSFVREGDHVVAEIRISRLTHGLTDRSDEINLLPSEPGEYDLTWRAYVGNLREPTEGKLAIKVGPIQSSGAPLATLGSVVASEYVPIRRGTGPSL